MRASKFFKFLPLYLIAYTPLFILYGLSNISYLIIYKIIHYRQKVVQKNLQRSFVGKTNEEIAQIEKQFYHNFGDIFIETIKPLGWNKNTMLKHAHYTNPELLNYYYNQDKNIILYSAHFGNWEWFLSLPLITQHQVTSLYRKLKNAYFDDLMLHIRSKFGCINFEMKTAFKNLMLLDKKGVRTLTIMIGDQSPDPHSAKHWVNFLNQDTAFFKGAELIGRKMDAVIIYPSIKKAKRGQYEITFKVIEESAKLSDENAIVAKYAELLEMDINASPDLWLWTHRRWKSKVKRDVEKQNS